MTCLLNVGFLLLCPLLLGCAVAAQVMGTTWHAKCGWKAENYFDDPKVVELCHAIEANDLNAMDRLIAAGVDVNAKGKGNMTPLLWAYPDNKLERFKKLLEHGANPNVVVESDFNTHGGMLPGDSVTHMACRTSFPGYFEAVFANGGDTNLPYTRKPLYSTPIFTLIQGSAPNKREKVKILIDKGAHLDRGDGRIGDGPTPAMNAVVLGQYDTALAILEAGADPNVYRTLDNQKLIHMVVGDSERRRDSWTPQQKADNEKLVAWLTSHGQSVEDARADRARWKSWSGTTGEYHRKMAAEVAARKTKEAREKAAAKKTDNDEK